MLPCRILVVALASAIAMLANQANGNILFTTGAMTPIPAPVSFVTDATESSTSIAILDEGVSVLPGNVFVNAYTVGVHGDTPPPYLMVPSATRVHSYFVHFDPIGSSFATLTRAVFFDPGETIIGVQTHTPLLIVAWRNLDSWQQRKTLASVVKEVRFDPNGGTIAVTLADDALEQLRCN